MNIISKIADIAWGRVLDDTKIDGEEQDSFSPEEIVLFERMFSKLLIQECAKVVNDNDFDGSTLGTDLLMNHFGFKEK